MQSLYALKLTISNFCPYRCKYCYVNTEDTKVIEEQRLYQAIDYYMSQKSDEKIVFFLWGESLIQFDILKKWILRIREKWKCENTHIFITTSWLSLNQEKIDFFYNHKIKLWVSIDGDSSIHGTNRVSQLWKNTYAATKTAVKLINTLYDEKTTWYAMTVDENIVEHTFRSFLFLSHLDKSHRNITIAWVYKNGWKKDNIVLLRNELEKICQFIFMKIWRGNFYFYNVLSFFILQILKGNSLEKGNIEMHVFPDWQVSLHLFAQSILWNIGNDPTESRFEFVKQYAQSIIKKAEIDPLYKSYINELYSRPIL